MRNEFTAIVEQDGPWFIAYCAEVPGPNGQGKTREECLSNLREAIALLLEHRRFTGPWDRTGWCTGC
jgi:predicted RNase H-like HicB family nuclease